VNPYYQDSAVTIYHGDCREILADFPKLDLVLTDPPYGVKLEGSPWDKSIPLPQEWLYPLLGKTITILITPGNGNQGVYPRPTWTLSWFRPGSVQHALRAKCFSHWEPILLYGENRFDVDAKEFSPNNPDSNNGHPCPKPLKLFSWLISGSNVEGVTIDPFMGSGTTLRAAKDLGRKAIGIEIDERYCEIAACRMAQEILTEVEFPMTTQWIEPVPLEIEQLKLIA
jgi:site-specific DNA-methyltransferase (adenine-specific)